jgi:hypothetical protein
LKREEEVAVPPGPGNRLGSCPDGYPLHFNSPRNVGAMSRLDKVGFRTLRRIPRKPLRQGNYFDGCPDVKRAVLPVPAKMSISFREYLGKPSRPFGVLTVTFSCSCSREATRSRKWYLSMVIRCRWIEPRSYC